MFGTIREQIDTIFREDPAAKRVVEIFLCYPGFHAIMAHRLAHRLYQWRIPLVPRVISQISRLFTQIESQKEIEFHSRRLISFRPKTSRARMAEMKRFVFEVGGLHLDCEMIHTKAIVKFRAQLL